MSIILGTVGFVLLIVWVLTIVDVVKRPLGRKETFAWILLVVIVPFIGAALYWILRKPSAEELDATVEARRELRDNPPGAPYGGSHLG